MEDIRFEPERNLDRNMFTRLATLDFVRRKENLIITGTSGVGKSFLAQALGHQACFNGLKTLYSNTACLFARMKLAKTDGTYLKELGKLQKANLLILDDFGLQALDNHSRQALLDIIDDWYNKTSTIIVSQIPVSVWYDIIGEGTIADAILDRMVSSSHRIDLKGESKRKGILKTHDYFFCIITPSLKVAPFQPKSVARSDRNRQYQISHTRLEGSSSPELLLGSDPFCVLIREMPLPGNGFCQFARYPMDRLCFLSHRGLHFHILLLWEGVYRPNHRRLLHLPS